MKKLAIVIFFICILNVINTAQNLVLYTTFDDASSITSPEMGPPGTQNGGSFAAAQYNDGFLSDADGEYIDFDIGASSGFESGKLNETTGTIAFWLKPSYNGSNDDVSRIFCALNDNQLMIFHYAVNSRLEFRINYFLKAVYNPTWSSGDLVHIAVVWDAAGSNPDIDGGKSVAFYVNGSVVDWNTSTWTPTAMNGSDFRIGADADLSPNQEAQAVIDDLYVYDYVLTSAQINNLKDNPLPVELISFSANLFESSVKLNWTTATEVNNYGFEVERRKTEISNQNSVEGNNEWEKISFVNGHGNSNSPKHYSFVDDNAPIGEVQYRLKQIDFDGAFEYSDVVTINNSQNYKFDLAQNYPNPFNPTTTISFTIPSVVDANFASTTLKIYDVLGSEVAALVNEKKTPGNYKINFNSSNLASGMYFYTLTSGSFRQTKKMLLIK